MRENFSVEQPKDTGDDRVTFIIKFNGTVLPGFIARDVLVGIGGLTTNNLVSLFMQHHAVIAPQCGERYRPHCAIHLHHRRRSDLTF